MEKEAPCQDQRWGSMQQGQQQQQMQPQQGGSNDASEAEEPSRPPARFLREPPNLKLPNLHPLTPDDDIEHFLTTFERIATVGRWNREDWTIHLVPLLTGEARSAYVAMEIEHSNDYHKVKESILTKYEITANTYHQCFSSLDIQRW
ncbi:hypothetical protein ANANG_G00177650 [Anguilla anguilla]|uniref:Uncharacterized protein n=1 Tax=Anguilla anguilla TaxID=7936 RepID=A0A9D3MB88_ANGAN|nr:hypothetical protein ANANG_G00177650 [Anguilla anguilla]